MAIAILKPDATGKRRLVPLSAERALRFKAILDGKAIPTAFEKQKASMIAKIYLSKSSIYPQEVKREVRKPYKES